MTALPQPGNPRPRLFRLPRDRAIVNRMGFNNDGAEVVARRLADRARRVVSTSLDQRGARTVVGVNIGKSKVVPEADAKLQGGSVTVGPSSASSFGVARTGQVLT